MTKEQKVEMFSMRLDGATYEEIAEKFGISKQRVNQIIHKEPKNRCIEKNVFIAGWLITLPATDFQHSSFLKKYSLKLAILHL